MNLRIISIGTLPSHSLWGERGQVRTGHATTALIVSGETRILVDPGLPEQMLVARLAERAALSPSQITDVFLTSFRADARRGIGAFTSATWWISEGEREGVGIPLATRLRDVSQDPEQQEISAVLQRDIAVLQRCKPAPEELAERVTLFPLPGVTPGMSGLLLEDARYTVVLTGDAIPTIEHLERGQVPDDAVNLEQARESFADAVEVADMLVLGRDNLVVNPTKRPF